MKSIEGLAVESSRQCGGGSVPESVIKLTDFETKASNRGAWLSVCWENTSWSVRRPADLLVNDFVAVKANALIFAA